jgi:hypothetical protein
MIGQWHETQLLEKNQLLWWLCSAHAMHTSVEAQQNKRKGISL